MIEKLKLERIIKILLVIVMAIITIQLFWQRNYLYGLLWALFLWLNINGLKNTDKQQQIAQNTPQGTSQPLQDKIEAFIDKNIDKLKELQKKPEEPISKPLQDKINAFAEKNIEKSRKNDGVALAG